MGNKDDVVTFIDAKTHRSKAEEQFKFEVNEISWNNDNNMFFLTNGNGCINILRWVPVVGRVPRLAALVHHCLLRQIANPSAASGEPESHIPVIPCHYDGSKLAWKEVAPFLGWTLCM